MEHYITRLNKFGHFWLEKIYNHWFRIFTESTDRLIQSIRRYVPLVDDRNQEGWRILVKDCISKMAKHVTHDT